MRSQRESRNKDRKRKVAALPPRKDKQMGIEGNQAETARKRKKKDTACFPEGSRGCTCASRLPGTPFSPSLPHCIPSTNSTSFGSPSLFLQRPFPRGRALAIASHRDGLKSIHKPPNPGEHRKIINPETALQLKNCLGF